MTEGELRPADQGFALSNKPLPAPAPMLSREEVDEIEHAASLLSGESSGPNARRCAVELRALATRYGGEEG